MNLLAQMQLSPFDEIAPVLGYLCLAVFAALVVWWEWRRSESDRMRRKRQAAAFDAQRQRWLTRKTEVSSHLKDVS